MTKEEARYVIEGCRAYVKLLKQYRNAEREPSARNELTKYIDVTLNKINQLKQKYFFTEKI